MWGFCLNGAFALTLRAVLVASLFLEFTTIYSFNNMKKFVRSLRLFSPLLLLSLFACSGGGGGGGGGGGLSIPTGSPAPIAPIFTSVIPGDEQVQLTWTDVDFPIGDVTDGAPIVTFNLYYANATANGISIDDLLATVTEVEDIMAIDGFQLEEGIEELNFTVEGLDNLSLFFFILTAVDGEEEGPVSQIEATAMPRATEVSNQPLADTGVTLCADFAFGIDAQDTNGNGFLSFAELDVDSDGNILEHDNRIVCGVGDNDGDPIPPLAQQDAGQGLDAADPPDETDGVAGFSFTKLDENGDPLDASATDWSCVQDNITGLIWEAKTDDPDSLHYFEDRFSWYNPDNTQNGEEPGFELPSSSTANGGQGDDICFGFAGGASITFCNTSAFIDRVNFDALCGFIDWRLPDLVELRSLVNYGIDNDDSVNLIPSVDLSFFPNTAVDGGIPDSTADGGIRYWSSQTTAGSPNSAWTMFYGFGGAPALDKGTPNVVRLVRSEPEG